MLCEYGCGREAIYQLKNGKWCCGSSYNKCPELRRKNSEGLKRAHEIGKLNAKEIYKNKSQEAKQRMIHTYPLKKKEDIENSRFVSSDTIKKMIEYHMIDLEYKCSHCGNTGEWNGKKLRLELHHIDGNHNNNKIKNLTFLCPNCHSQTDSFRFRGTRTWVTPSSKLIEENLPKYNNDIDLLIKELKIKNKTTAYKIYLRLIKEGKISIS